MILLYEFKKLFKNKLFYLAIAITLLLTVFFMLDRGNHEKSYMRTWGLRYEEAFNTALDDEDVMIKKMFLFGLTPEEEEHKKGLNQIHSDLIYYTYCAAGTYEVKDYRELLIKINDLVADCIDNGLMRSSINSEDFRNENFYVRNAIENDYDLTFIHNDTSFIYSFIDFHSSNFMLLFIVLFITLSVSIYLENGDGNTFKSLFLLPQGRINILISKFIVCLFAQIVICVVWIGSWYLYSNGNIGSLNYIYKVNANNEIITCLSIIKSYFIFDALLLLANCAIACLLSYLFNNSIIALAISSLVCIVCFSYIYSVIAGGVVLSNNFIYIIGIIVISLLVIFVSNFAINRLEIK